MVRSLLHLLAVAALGWSHAVGVQAQNYVSLNSGPFRTFSDGAATLLMLEGTDPVAYFTQGAAIKGDPATTLTHRGVIYRFSNEVNKATFARAPEKYMPQFGGFCANDMTFGIPWRGGGGGNDWRIYHGKLYVFGGQKARDYFEMDTQRNLERAHKYWNDEVAGSNARFARYKRLIFRVPHYKSDRQLLDEWESKLASKSLPVMPGNSQVVPAQ